MNRMYIDVFDNRYWFKDSQFHREDGPAVERVDGYQSWWFEGNRHRNDGPAVIKNNGDIEYWLNGKQVSEIDLSITDPDEKELIEIGKKLRNKIK